MLVGGPFWPTALMHLILIMLLLDAYNGKLPKAFIAIPIIAYAGYFGMYIKDSIRISLHERALQSKNPVSVIKFDPDIHDLVIGDAYRFVAEYQIPVAYQKDHGDNPEGYLSYQLLDQKSCEALKVAMQPGMRLTRVQSKDNRRNGNCILTTPDRPSKEQITFENEPDYSSANKGTIVEGGYVLEHDGKAVAKYRTATVQRFSLLPLPFIGCGRRAFVTRWECEAGFWRTGQRLETRPASAPDELGNDPVAIMLGIQLRYPGDKHSLREERLLR